MNNIANWLTMHIKDNVSDLTDLQLIKIKFGIECLLSEASKTIIYILFLLLQKYFVAGILAGSLKE